MAIFDDIRGLVPLPKTRKGKSNSTVDSTLAGVSDGVFSPEFPLPLPDYNQPDTSGTVVDTLYTKINDVFEYISLPTPEVLQNIYGVTQRIEGIIEDPVTAVRNAVNRGIYELLHPKEENLYPTDQSGSYRKSEDVKTNEIIDVTAGTRGVRVPLVEKDLQGSARLRSGDYLQESLEPELIRSFKGRESLTEVTLRSVDLWDLKIEPFEYNGVPNKWVPPIQQEDNSTINTSSKYADLFPTSIPSVTDYMPILSYDVDLKTLTTKQLDLYGGSSIAVPDLIRYNSRLSLQILDDENKRWRRWFQTYAENLFDDTSNAVAPYKNSSLLITLYQYRQDFKVLSLNKYICSLNNYQMLSMGAGSASTDVIDIEFSIVGRIDLAPTYSYLQIT